MSDTLPETIFNGTVTRGGEAVPVTFTAHAGSDFRLHVALAPIPMASAKPLWNCLGQPGDETESLTLEGTSQNGWRFFSDAADPISWRHKDGLELGVLVRKAVITVPLDQPAPFPVLRFWTRSFRSFRNSPQETDLGILHVWGTEKDVPNDDIGGSISLQGPASEVPANWAEDAERFVKFVWSCLAFAHGGRLQAPLTELYMGGTVAHTYYYGSASVPELPVVPFLEHDPFIKAICDRFFVAEPFPEIIWTAVGWMQLDTTADEGRLISAMTAVEAIVEGLTPEAQTTIVPKAEFSDTRDQMISAIQSSSLPADAQAILTNKVKGLNSRSLSQKVEALRDHCGLSRDKYDRDAIVAMIKERNAIVHTGIGHREEIWQHILMARELIADVVFHELGYRGVRQSYLDGYKLVHPEKTSADGAQSADVDLK